MSRAANNIFRKDECLTRSPFHFGQTRKAVWNALCCLLLGCSSDSKFWSFVRGGGSGVSGLACGLEVRGRVWNWVWFLKELREFSSIPNE